VGILIFEGMDFKYIPIINIFLVHTPYKWTYQLAEKRDMTSRQGDQYVHNPM
jgi:hypothetical protein